MSRAARFVLLVVAAMVALSLGGGVVAVADLAGPGGSPVADLAGPGG